MGHVSFLTLNHQCQSTKMAWPHPIFTHQLTLQQREIASFMPALRRQFYNDSNETKVTTELEATVIKHKHIYIEQVNNSLSFSLTFISTCNKFTEGWLVGWEINFPFQFLGGDLVQPA